jgi:hypothetical protein
MGQENSLQKRWVAGLYVQDLDIFGGEGEKEGLEKHGFTFHGYFLFLAEYFDNLFKVF